MKLEEIIGKEFSSEQSVVTDPSRKIRIDGKHFVVSFNYNAELVADVKKIPGRRFNPDTKEWSIPINSDTVDLVVDFVENNNFTPEDKEALDEVVRSYQEAYEKSMQTDADVEIEDLGGELMPFQKAGVAYVVDKKKTFIADDMGLGKTIQALASLEHLDSFPALIVCPASVLYNWKKEAEKWLPKRSSKVLVAEDPFPDADVNVITYGRFIRYIEDLENFKFQAVVFDESHRLKNYKTKSAEAAKKIVRRVPVRLLLSGTPIINKPKDLLSQLSIMGRINDFGGFWAFAKRYCNAKKTRFGWDMDGAANLKELNQKLRQNCMIRRKKEQVLKELPEKIYTILEVDITNRKEYDKMIAEFISFLKQKVKLTKKEMEEAEALPEAEREMFIYEKKLEKMRKLTKSKELVKMSVLSSLVSKGKEKVAIEWIEDFLQDSEEKLIVFINHKSFGETLAKKFNAMLINGETPPKVRQKYIDKFQTDPNERLIILNIQAGSEGITLTAATHVLFLEYPMVPALLDQAESRAHRKGQTRGVNIYYMVARDTIEVDIIKLLDTKRKIVQEATDGASSSSESILEEFLVGLAAE